MADPFDEVLGQGRGSGREPGDDSPLVVARRLVAFINSPEAPWERTTPQAVMEELIPEHGLALHRELSFVHDHDHDGFMLTLSVTADRPPFAALWLHDNPGRDRTPYAELWVLDAPPR